MGMVLSAVGACLLFILKAVGILLLILLVLAFATGAHAAQDDYYYPNYDVSANGCVDLMNYVKRVTVTVNGVDYTSWTRCASREPR